ncbi:hypothetical protein TRAPUB_6188 [Trametes pubescens]|uniref:Uncharacterized protein n=1 Tax=Trametes pubescens TaxID=154538 RepID=A0A1M2VN23_TRAPU|nr:hypothetical protein TRAPUB_138 [Trametes pubescens]OJT11726.1 hypothetical protein TRAPUB_11750 [Trametes pubescens]OJT15588.1 hypothetical protein TRAPUB_6188 [Trametes pubescens]
MSTPPSPTCSPARSPACGPVLDAVGLALARRSPPVLSPSPHPAVPLSYAQVVRTPPGSPRAASPARESPMWTTVSRTGRRAAPPGAPERAASGAPPQHLAVYAESRSRTPAVTRSAQAASPARTLSASPPRRRFAVTPPSTTTTLSEETVLTRTLPPGEMEARLSTSDVAPPATIHRRTKRARLESASPSPPPPPATPRGRPGSPGLLQRTRFVHRTRPTLVATPRTRAPLLGTPTAPTRFNPASTLTPAQPAAPTPRHVTFEVNYGPQPASGFAASYTRNATAGPSSSRRPATPGPSTASSSRPPISVPGSEHHIFLTDQDFYGPNLDIPLTRSSSHSSSSSFGQPLHSLDLNRARFPTALHRTISDEDAHRVAFEEYLRELDAGIASAVPIPIRTMASMRSTPAPDAHGLPEPMDVISEVFGATISPSNARPTTPSPISVLGGARPSPFHLPVPRGLPPVPFWDSNILSPVVPPAPIPIQQGGPIGGTAFTTAMNHLYATHGAAAAAEHVFTPVPLGGYPEVVLGDPEGLYAGLPRARAAAMQDDSTGPRLAICIWNSTLPNTGDVRPITNALASSIQAATGELDPLIVPPERQWEHVGAGPVQPRTWAVLGVSAESAQTLISRRVWSSQAITFFAYSPTNRVLPRFLGIIGGFSHNHNNSIYSAVLSTFRGSRILPAILQLVQTNRDDFEDVRPEAVARLILGSLQVRVSTLQNGNLIGAVFCTSPTRSVSRWREWRDLIVSLAYPSALNTTGSFRRQGLCAACHGSDHLTHLCPFSDVPGWNAPAAGTRWSHPSPGLLLPAPGQGAPPPPGPPPAPGASSSRGRPARGPSRPGPPGPSRRDRRPDGFGDENSRLF